MTQQPQPLDSYGIDRIIELCNKGFESNSRSAYKLIVDIAKRYEPSEKLDIIIKLAEGGETLLSKKFAYPHIEGYAEELKKDLNL